MNSTFDFLQVVKAYHKESGFHQPAAPDMNINMQAGFFFVHHLTVTVHEFQIIANW